MLTRLTVNNFKSLADIEIELGQVNVFVGANGSGKSNLLEAIATLIILIEWQKQPPLALLQHGARPAPSSLFFSSFKGTEEKEAKIAVNETSGWQSLVNLRLQSKGIQDDYECVKSDKKKPGYLLSLEEYGKLTQRKNGKIKKRVKRYCKITEQIADKWDTVCHICSQASNFDKKITEKYDLKENLENIRHRIQEAAIRCNRNPETIRLVAVSKTVSADRVQEAIETGVTILGENYIQEAQQKIDDLSSFPVFWHFIGHLQSNKAKYAVKLFNLIHSVDSLKLARELDRQAKKINKVQDILIQVNIGEEISKSGTAVEELHALVKDISKLESLSVRGLMIIPPFYDEPEKVRPYFSKLRELRNQIKEQEIPNIKMDELSMGMTGDFEAAIEEGATLVRIGTAVFGRR